MPYNKDKDAIILISPGHRDMLRKLKAKQKRTMRVIIELLIEKAFSDEKLI